MMVIAIDQGTTSTRAMAFDRRGNVCASAQTAFPQYFPQPGWVEHNPLEILESTLFCLRQIAQQIDTAQVAAIGITNQRETTVVWDKRTGQPVYPAIVWQSRQTVAYCEQLKARSLEAEIRYKTGLVIDAYFSATKIQWILDHAPGARALAEQGHLLFGTVDTWLLWHLSREQVHATDFSNASRTMLFNLHTLQWDDNLCQTLDIPMNLLPEVRDSSGGFGHMGDKVPELAGIPISGIAGDQQAALFGQACFSPGLAKNTYGTGCFLLMHTGDAPVPSAQGLLTTLAWGIGGKVEYALEGSVFVAGSAIQWLRDQLGVLTDSAESEALARSLPDNEGVYLVPAFVGLGTPYWDSAVRGAVFGLTRGSGKAHLARAALECIAYQTRDVLEMMEQEAGIALQSLRVDGGMVGNDFLLQFQSDLLGTQVDRPVVQETTALGAAYLAGLAVGFWESREDIEKNWQLDQVFKPEMDRERAESIYGGWKKAVAAARSF